MLCLLIHLQSLLNIQKTRVCVCQLASALISKCERDSEQSDFIRARKCLCVTQLNTESTTVSVRGGGVSAVYMQWFYKTKLIMMLAAEGNHNNRPTALSQASSNKLQSAH